MMLKAFFWNRSWIIYAYGAGLVLLGLLYLQVQLLVQFNSWYKVFYDLLQSPTHTISGFWVLIKLFWTIAFKYIVLATIVAYLTRRYSLWWREAITFSYLPRWLNTTVKIEGESQRIQEDTYRFAKIIETLVLQFARGVLTLFAFIPILWVLSENVSLGPLLPSWANVGHPLLWAALLTSIGGMVISWFVGWKLPGLEYNNQLCEAAFRKELVLGEDDRVNYASLPVSTIMFGAIKKNYKRLFLHYGYFDGWSNLYNQAMVIVPFCIIAPNFFAGVVTLGIVMQVANTFSQVNDSCSLFINNWTTITELRSIQLRLKEFENKLMPC